MGPLRVSAGKEDHAPPAGKHRFLLAFITETVVSKRGCWEEEGQVIENPERHFCHRSGLLSCKRTKAGRTASKSSSHLAFTTWTAQVVRDPVLFQMENDGYKDRNA